MSVSPRNVNLGSTLTVTCTGTLDQAGVLGPKMEIHKKILGTIYTISDGDRLNVPYASNARYSIKKYSNPTNTMYTFILTVKSKDIVYLCMHVCMHIIMYVYMYPKMWWVLKNTTFSAKSVCCDLVYMKHEY